MSVRQKKRKKERKKERLPDADRLLDEDHVGDLVPGVLVMTEGPVAVRPEWAWKNNNKKKPNKRIC